MSKNFSYEISELRKQQQMLRNLAWSMKTRYVYKSYVRIAVGHIHKSKDELKQAIETLERGEI